MLPSLRKNISEVSIPLHFQKSALEANSFAINHYALALSNKLCGSDGNINLAEKRAFLVLFPYFGEDGLSLLSNEINISTYNVCKRFLKFSAAEKSTSARLYARLFKLAGSDEALNVFEVSFLEKIASMLGLSLNYLEKALEYYFLGNLKHSQNNHPKELRRFYLTQIAKLHPDNFIGDDILSKRIKNTIVTLATERTKILNENYQYAIS